MSALDEFMHFCYEHGRTLKAHKMFGELYRQAAAELAQLRQELADAKGRYIRGGDGSHWEGCEETHWDCKIAKLERENAELRKALIDTQHALRRSMAYLDIDNLTMQSFYRELAAVLKAHPAQKGDES
jgi:hypothetical protein